jgi:hypothetical protein
MSKTKTGLISKDFPLYHSDIIPTYTDTNSHKHTHSFSNKRILYTNEHPEIFRLEGMKQGGYFNPYISESIKVDRSEYLKKLNNDRKNVNFIDFVKSNRKYSQDPKIIRYITVDTNKELIHKRLGKNKLNSELNNLTKNDEIKMNSNGVSLTEGNEKNNLIRKLSYYVPKIDYRIKRTLDMDSVNKNKRYETINNISVDDSSIKCNNPVNMKNFSNFKLSDMNSDTNKNSNEYDFKFNRKSVRQYNPIKDKMESITPPPFNNKKWSSFLENYFLLENTGKKFSRKGGLFSEFCNKNKNNISINKYYLQQKLKTQKEEKEKSKEKKI